MKLRTFTIFALLASVAFAAAGVAPRTVKADEVSTATSTASSTASVALDCTLSGSIVSQIKAIQKDRSLSAKEEQAAELAARESLLTEVITCAKANAEALQMTLSTTAVPSSAAGAQSALSGAIDDAISYYNAELAKVDDADIPQTQAISKALLEWKTAHYDPLLGQVSNFILWASNQDLFTTAQNRMDQTGNIIAFLETAGKDESLEHALSLAQGDFASAQKENQSAKGALSELLPPDQSLDLIQQSLKDLAKTYKDFAKISTLVQTLLPTENK